MTNKSARAHQFRTSSESRYTQIYRIYQALFNDIDNGQQAGELKEALRKYSPSRPGSEAEALGVLRTLNDNKEPPFNSEDLAALRLLFIPPKAMSPAQRDTKLAVQARRFWRALVLSDVVVIEELWSAIHAYDVHASDQTRGALVNILTALVPDSAWSDAQLGSLVSIAVHDVEFRNLAWWDAFHDFW